MKIKKLIYTLSTIFSIVACEKDYEVPNTFADVNWHLSVESGNTTPIILSENSAAWFMNLSQGAINSRWEVSEKGTYFLKSAPPNNTEDFSSYIDHTISHINKENKIMVLFTEQGEHSVRLYNEFNSMVNFTYLDRSVFPYVKKTKYAVKQGDIYVMDTIMKVDVFSKVITPGAKVYRDASCQEEIELGYNPDGTFKTINLSAGEELYFVDDSYYKPNTYEWSCRNGSKEDTRVQIANPSLQATAIKFSDWSNGDTIKINLAVSREKISDNDYIVSAPQVDTIIPLGVIIDPSTDPVSAISKYLTSNKIAIKLENAKFDESAKDVSINDFALTIMNNTKGYISQNIVPSNIELNEEDKTMLELTFNETIYNDDSLSINYTQGETPLLAFDGRVIESFVYNYTVDANILPQEYFDFENLAGMNKWKCSDAKAIVELRKDPKNENSQCVMIDTKKANAKFEYDIAKFDVTPGDYTLTLEIYHNSVCPIFQVVNGPKPTIAFPAKADANSWQKVSYTNKCYADVPNVHFLVKTPKAGVYYIKNIKFVKNNDRP